jgi:hypothetical protein
MSAQPAFPRRGFVASALARAESWLLEPVEDSVENAAALVRPRPVVAVFGLADGCGATTVTRALGAELAARDPGGACAVSASRRSAALPLGSPAAARLARTLELQLQGAWTQASGRLCLIDCGDLGRLADAARYVAPLVLDAGRTTVGGALAALADMTLLIASSRVEPALASVARGSLRADQDSLVVLNRASDLAAFDGVADVLLPESRVGAQLAQAGREPRGELGRAISELADRCEGAQPG